MDELSEVTVLHTVRLAGVSDLGRLSRRLRIAQDRLEPRLRSMQAEGLLKRHDGSLSGWALTAQGRARGAELVAEELDRRGARRRVEECYRSFLELNGGVLQACTDWQVRAGSDPMVLNDHSDPQYDARVLEHLASLHSQALEVLEELQEALARFGIYPPRLSKALAQARTGDVDWVTKPVMDSYHTVWFELHEDLLSTLGRTRSEEQPGRHDRNPA